MATALHRCFNRCPLLACTSTFGDPVVERSQFFTRILRASVFTFLGVEKAFSFVACSCKALVDGLSDSEWCLIHADCGRVGGRAIFGPFLYRVPHRWAYRSASGLAPISCGSISLVVLILNDSHPSHSFDTDHISLAVARVQACHASLVLDGSSS